MSRWLLLLLLCSAWSASAQEKLFVLVPAINAAVGPASGRNANECVLDEIIGNDVFKAVQARIPDSTRVDKEPGAGDGGLLLRVVIVDIIGWGGGGWTGSKRMSVRAELVQGGKVLQSRDWTQRSRGGVLGPVKGTCAIFEDISNIIAGRVAAWMVIRNRPKQPDLQPTAEERKESDDEKQ